MPTKTVRTATHFVIDGDDQFEVTHAPIDETEVVRINETKDCAVVGYLASDDATSDWYFNDRDGGEFYGFDPRMMGHRPLDEEEIKALFEENPERVFWINKYEHGLVKFYRQDLGASECPWDTSHGVALYVAPDDTPDPAKYCDGVMEELTDWCNGEIFGVCVETYTRNGPAWKPDTEDSCWNYIGRSYAESELESEVKAHTEVAPWQPSSPTPEMESAA